MESYPKGNLFRRRLRRSPSGRVTGGSIEFIRVYPADGGVVMVTGNRQQIVFSQKGQTGVGVGTLSHQVAQAPINLETAPAREVG